MKKLPLIIITVVYVFISLSLLQAQDVKIRTENGIQVVYNPKNPVPLPGTPKEILLRQDLCIGDEEGVEDFIFSQIRSVQVDEEGNIYVLDWKEVCVKVFNKNAKHVRTFGKKGQGPGEMQGPARMHMCAGKEIMIYDIFNNRLSFYSLDGKCLREIDTGKYRFARAIPDSKRNIIGQTMAFGEKFVNEIKKYDPELNPILEIASIEQERNLNVINMISPVINVRLTKNDHIVWGISSKYEIFIVNPEGKTIRKIIKDYDPVKITEAKKKEMIKEAFGDRGVPPGRRLEFPKYYHPYYYFICDDEGRMYVQTYEKDKEGDIYFNVFDAEGRYIVKFSLPEGEFPYIVKKNKMYSYIRESEEGIPIVKRYSVIWK